MAQLVEQLIRNQQVAGSSPVTSSKKTYTFVYVFLCKLSITGLELGASNHSCVFAFRQKNSPVDCFAGGSREASPVTSSKKDKSLTCLFFARRDFHPRFNPLAGDGNPFVAKIVKGRCGDISPNRGIPRHQLHVKARLYGLAFCFAQKAKLVSLLFLVAKSSTILFVITYYTKRFF